MHNKYAIEITVDIVERNDIIENGDRIKQRRQVGFQTDC